VRCRRRVTPEQAMMRTYWPEQQSLDRFWVEPVMQKVQTP
jgi:hypothetical protein